MSLKQSDSKIYELINSENKRQAEVIRLIPSENYASEAVMEATGSILTNKYSEGYAHKRYYEGQEFIDEIEELAIARAKELFKAEHVNVQPYSGSPANLAVYMGLLEPGDKIMGMNLLHGGHLTHGWNVSATAKIFESVQYTVDKETKLINFDTLRDQVLKEKPKLIIAGATAYPRVIDWYKFREVADSVGAYLLADIAHIAGLIAGGVHPSPVGVADVVTTTTHKTLRGPRGGMIMCKEELAEKIDRAIFPGLQGGPHNNTTAAIAVALKEAATDEFKEYAKQIVANAKALAEKLLEKGFELVTGGTDNHLLLIDMTNKSLSGKKTAKALAVAGIICNANTVPYDTNPPLKPSGIRLGTPAITSRGMKEKEMERIAKWMDRIVQDPENENTIKGVKNEVLSFCKDFPPPGITV
ncbi:MAG: serine hydroxymethyltransferase [bacterium]